MKLCAVLMVISFLLLSYSAATSGNENINWKDERNSGKAEKSSPTEITEKIQSNSEKSTDIPEKIAESTTANTTAKTSNNWEVPTWVFGFVQGIFVMIGIAIGYSCFRANEGHVTEAEWQEMGGNK